MSLRIKICGITRAADAEAAVQAGADALGFVLWDGSPRRVVAADLASITAGLPPSVARVGVFVNEPRASLEAAVRSFHLSTAQLHGDEDANYCRSLEIDWYRAFRVGPDTEASTVAGAIIRLGQPAFMLDTRSGAAPGGTGRSLDWRIAARISMRTALAGRFRLILAGGLTPGNVAQAIRLVRPWAVDVSSGVESSPGVKDPELMKAFVDAARAAP